MATPFFVNGAGIKRDQIVAIDLGGRNTKAVHVQRKGNDYVIGGYAILDAPVFEKTLPVELLTEHLKSVMLAVGAKAKLLSLAVGVNDSILRLVDMPRIPVDEIRQAVKFNTKTYLQQDLPNHCFDCYVVPQAAGGGQASPGTGSKQKVLVGGAKKKFLDEVIEASKGVGWTADNVIPSLVCPGNAFEMAMPDVFVNEVVALVDIGFKSSFICILQGGSLVLNRVVGLGGNQITEGLAESMNISYAEAEGIKLGMPHEVQSQLESLVSPLGRELRASIDFFEHQQDRAVSKVYLSGGATQSDLIVQALQTELMVECVTWNPAAKLQAALPESQTADFAHAAPQLGVALGAAYAAL
jgi:type IV pilus assembly protein PilM